MTVPHRFLFSALLVGLAVAVIPAGAQPQGKQRPRDGSLKAGDPAPDISLGDLTGKKTVKLADLRGKPAVLIFGSCT